MHQNPGDVLFMVIALKCYPRLSKYRCCLGACDERVRHASFPSLHLGPPQETKGSQQITTPCFLGLFQAKGTQSLTGSGLISLMQLM